MNIDHTKRVVEMIPYMSGVETETLTLTLEKLEKMWDFILRLMKVKGVLDLSLNTKKLVSGLRI